MAQTTAQTRPPRLGRLDLAQFLSEHWQRQPVLLRQALADFRNPIEPDELAGLALEAEVEARLVLHDRERDRYLLEHGPFDPDRFASLPARDWTLLVQAVDQWVPGVAALIEPFRIFVPDWRIDDVMVSYATVGGGVGPHYDHYDVFLVQGLGRRRWRIGPRADADTALQPDTPLRLLQTFPIGAEYLLEPGDVLYVPPGWGHWGEAEDEACMTYSVGLRAPDQAELVGHWCDRVLADCSPFDRYTDPSGPPIIANAADPAWLSDAAIEQAYQLMLARTADKAGFGRWLGEWLSEPKYPDQVESPSEPLNAEQLHALLNENYRLARNPGSRLLLQARSPLHSPQVGQAQDTDLCADGQRHPLNEATVELGRHLCALPRHGALNLDRSLGPAQLALLTALYNQGSVFLTDDKDDLGSPPL